MASITSLTFAACLCSSSVKFAACQVLRANDLTTFVNNILSISSSLVPATVARTFASFSFKFFYFKNESVPRSPESPAPTGGGCAQCCSLSIEGMHVIRRTHHWHVLCCADDAPTSCSYFEFTCDDGTCIDSRLHCDGQFDCNDESDELFCGTLSRRNTNSNKLSIRLCTCFYCGCCKHSVVCMFLTDYSCNG